MSETIMPAFIRFPQEATIIGRLLAGYGDLEFDLCYCVAVARDDFDMAFKSMFRLDSIGRSKYRELKLGTQFAEAIAATDYCRRIRNQYAHCTTIGTQI